MKRVVVTGANGFIGKYTLKFLVKAGFEVCALRFRGEELQVEGVNWYTVDLMDFSAVNVLLEQLEATHLLHLAWYTEHGKFWHATENLQWVACSLNLVKCFVKHGGQRVVMAGSCAEYDWSSSHCSEQETECRPSTLYGVCKNSLRQISQAFCEQNNISFAWGRIFFLYGPGEVKNRFVPEVINSLLLQEKARCSDGEKIRDFMYVEDVASAFTSLLASDLNGAVNIASGESVTLKKIGELILNQIGGNGKLDFGALVNREGEPLILTADIKRLCDELGWRPTYSLDKGLEKTIDWWENGRENNYVY